MNIIGPAVKVNTQMDKWIENFLLIVSSIVIMVFLSMGMIIVVIMDWSKDK